MASALGNPIEASLGATLGAATGMLSGAAWLSSQLGKFGKYLAGTPGEIGAAAFGAGTGAAAGAAVGATLGALSGRLMVQYLLGGELASLATAPLDLASLPLKPLLGRDSPRPATPPAVEPPAATVPPAPGLFPG